MPRKRSTVGIQRLQDAIIYKSMRKKMKARQRSRRTETKSTPISWNRTRESTGRKSRGKNTQANPRYRELNVFLQKAEVPDDARRGLLLLSQRHSLLRAYDMFLDCDALLSGLRIGTLRKMLNMNFDILIENYLNRINELWRSIFRGVKDWTRLSQKTVEDLRLLAPGLSSNDSAHVSAMFNNKQIFANFHFDEQAQIKKNLLSLKDLIIDLTCLSEDWKIMEPVIKFVAIEEKCKPANLINKFSYDIAATRMAFVLDHIEEWDDRVITGHRKVQRSNTAKTGGANVPEDEPRALREGRPDHDWVSHRHLWKDTLSTTVIHPDLIRKSKIRAFFGHDLVLSTPSSNYSRNFETGDGPSLVNTPAGSTNYIDLITNPFRTESKEVVQEARPRSFHEVDQVPPVPLATSSARSAGWDTSEDEYHEISEPESDLPGTPKIDTDLGPWTPSRNGEFFSDTVYEPWKGNSGKIATFGLEDRGWIRQSDMTFGEWDVRARQHKDDMVIYNPISLRTETWSQHERQPYLFTGRSGRPIAITETLRKQAAEIISNDFQ